MSLSFSMSERDRSSSYNGSHAQTQPLLFLLLHDIDDTAQACQTACTSQGPPLETHRGPRLTTQHTSLEAMPAASGFFISLFFSV